MLDLNKASPKNETLILLLNQHAHKIQELTLAPLVPSEKNVNELLKKYLPSLTSCHTLTINYTHNEFSADLLSLLPESIKNIHLPRPPLELLKGFSKQKALAKKIKSLAFNSKNYAAFATILPLTEELTQLALQSINIFG